MSPAKTRTSPRKEASSADTTIERLTELAADPKLSRLVAANPSAPAELLLELSHSDDKAVRKACTSNANTPVEALLKLGAQFPVQLLENPVFDLLLLAHPGLFEELPTSTLNSLLKRDDVPVELIRWARKYRGESTLHSLLMNPNTPVDVVNDLCISKDPEVQIAAELHCSRELPGWAQSLISEADLYLTNTLACMLSMTASSFFDELLDALPLVLSDREIVFIIDFLPRSNLISKAKHSSSPTLLFFLSHSADWEVLFTLSANPMCPVEALESLARSGHKHIRANVAKHAYASPKILTDLSEDLIWEVRMHAAANTSTNDASLRRLSKDAVEEVRSAVAVNENAPESVLATLSSDQRGLVRASVASNAHTPARILVNLSRDKDKEVRMRVALNPTTPCVVRIMLRHKDVDIDVRMHASRPVTSQSENVPSIIKVEACNQLIRNTSTKDHDEDGKTEAEKKLNKILHSALLRSQPSPNHRFLLTFPQCPSSILARNFRSRCWLERFAIAGNPSTPDAVLQRMSNEGNQLVRRAAQTNLDQRAAKAD